MISYNETLESENIIDALRDAAEILGGDLRIPDHGKAPHILVQARGFRCSIVYLAKQNQWKIFFPYPSPEQIKKYFNSINALRDYCRDTLGVRC